MLATSCGGVVGFVVWLVSREKLTPIERNPVSRLIHLIYTPVLRFLLNRKRAFLAVPLVIVLLGCGAWVGLPKVLRPVEIAAGKLGADLNAVPGYVDFKHQLPGLNNGDWIALDEGSWFYMPTLFPAASFSEAMRILLLHLRNQ